jgi:hypothetical protein
MVVPHQVPNDFNGDGRTDILWRNETGVLGESLGLSDGGFAGNPIVDVPVSTDWQVAGIADFNGDGRSDILWRNPTTGVISESLGESNGGFAYNAVVNVPVSTDWQVAGIADFNGDGRSDILWRNPTTGVISESLGQSDGGFAYNPVVNVSVGTNWQVDAIGDFNGDGRSDILWRQSGPPSIGPGTARITESLGQPDGGFAANPVVDFGVGNNDKIAAVGDFNGDGRSDILWRDVGWWGQPESAGDVSVSLGQSNGGFAANPGARMSLTTDWHVASIGDVNGDGFDDVLLQNKDGRIAEWLGNGNGIFTPNPAANVSPDVHWHVQDPSIHDPFV